jgi:hypothetical protein
MRLLAVPLIDLRDSLPTGSYQQCQYRPTRHLKKNALVFEALASYTHGVLQSSNDYAAGTLYIIIEAAYFVAIASQVV